jgi:5-methylcytosine-specific restriction endonuclease McrA
LQLTAFDSASLGFTTNSVSDFCSKKSLNIHHIDYRENGGPTDLDNLIPLCSKHHHKAHEGGWKLSHDPNSRQLTVNYP